MYGSKAGLKPFKKTALRDVFKRILSLKQKEACLRESPNSPKCSRTPPGFARGRRIPDDVLYVGTTRKYVGWWVDGLGGLKERSRPKILDTDET